MKLRSTTGVLAAPLLMLALALPSHADTTCKDGTTSTSTGKGTCSGHGGVQKAAAAPSPGTTGAMAKDATTVAPATTTPAVSTGAPPAGATAKCKDGTFSMSKSHSGACSKHGGVADFLKSGK